MSTKAQVAALTQSLEDVGVDAATLESDRPEDRRRLGEVEFEVPGADFSVFMAADGDLTDVLFAEGALDRNERDQLADAIVATVNQAEQILEFSLEQLRRRENRRV